MPPTGQRPLLSAAWRYLVMLNYEIDPDILEPLVPAGTVLDRWRDRALVSLVGFRFTDTRVLGAAIPFHREFDEVNLRFYVRRHLTSAEVRRGVVFVRELVPRLAVALVARWAYNEPYRAVPMRSTAPDSRVDTPGRIVYEWRTGGRWQQLAATAVGLPLVPEATSEAAFITEHYWGYTRQRDGSTREYEVAHPVWRVWAAVNPVLDADVAELYGAPFEQALSGPPVSALIAEGSPVLVYAPRRLMRRGTGSFEPHAYQPDGLRIERRLADQVGGALGDKGHRVVTWPDWTWKAGGVCAVTIDQTSGVLSAGGDPRRTSYATGW